MTLLLDVVGMAAVLVGLWTLSHALALIVGGLIALVLSYAMEHSAKATDK